MPPFSIACRPKTSKSPGGPTDVQAWHRLPGDPAYRSYKIKVCVPLRQLDQMNLSSESHIFEIVIHVYPGIRHCSVSTFRVCRNCIDEVDFHVSCVG